MALPYNLYPWFRGTFQTTQLCTGKQIAPLLRQSLFFDQIKRQRLSTPAAPAFSLISLNACITRSFDTVYGFVPLKISSLFS